MLADGLVTLLDYKTQDATNKLQTMYSGQVRILLKWLQNERLL